MDLEDQDVQVGRFRPNSLTDFKSYAKHLASLIGEPLQRTQELLARIYGYSGVHELQATLRLPGAVGPYDIEAWRQEAVGQASRISVAATAVRGNKVLALVAAAKSTDLAGLNRRGWLARDLELFNPPDIHRDAFARVRAEADALDGIGHDGRNGNSSDYAFQDFSGAGELLLRFTPLGEGIFSGVLRQFESGDLLSKGGFERMRKQLEVIAERHPRAPWARSRLDCFIAEYHMNEWDPAIPFTPNLEQQSDDQRTAARLLPRMKASVALFEEMIGDPRGRKLAPSDLSSPMADNYTYPALLYWGGIVALHAGEIRLAQIWLNRNADCCPQDRFGTRYVLPQVGAVLNETGAARRATAPMRKRL